MSTATLFRGRLNALVWAPTAVRPHLSRSRRLVLLPFFLPCLLVPLHRLLVRTSVLTVLLLCCLLRVVRLAGVLASVVSYGVPVGTQTYWDGFHSCSVSLC